MKFGRVPLEIPAETSVSGLAPKFQDAIVKGVLPEMTAAGYDPIIAESVRTNARQQYLFGFGRDYDDGRGVVTHSKDGDETWHHFGLAVDIISKANEWDAPVDFWQALGRFAAAHNLTWGGNWQFKDLPHVQWGPPMRQSPSPRAARLLADGGLELVWAEVGAL